MVGVLELFDNAYRVDGTGFLDLPKRMNKRLGLHAVLLVEAEEKSKHEQVVFLNSWGVGWGDGGMGRFGADYFAQHCKQLWAI